MSVIRPNRNVSKKVIKLGFSKKGEPENARNTDNQKEAGCCLLNCVDDATGRVYLRFARSENIYDAMQTMWGYVNERGIPRSIYTDRGSIYRMLSR